MGFKFKPKDDTVTLTFAEDHELHGLEVVTRKQMPIGCFFEASRGDNLKALEVFCSQVVSWNAEDDDGNPIPATVQGIGGVMDIVQAGEMLDAWLEVIAQPSAPLGQRSGAGKRSGAKAR